MDTSMITQRVTLKLDKPNNRSSNARSMPWESQSVAPFSAREAIGTGLYANLSEVGKPSIRNHQGDLRCDSAG
jgi:hypothetical protein